MSPAISAYELVVELLVAPLLGAVARAFGPGVNASVYGNLQVTHVVATLAALAALGPSEPPPRFLASSTHLSKSKITIRD